MTRPEWMERVEDAVGDRPMPKYLIQAQTPDRLRPFVVRAARKRGMPVSAYLRRAVLAFVVRDLDLDWDEVMEDEPSIDAEDNLPPRRYRGRGFGNWKIRGLD